MSKFLLNLLLQISIALVNSKIQFLIRKFLFLISAPLTLRPPWPLAQPAHWPRRPRRPRPSRPAHPARASVTSSREIRLPFWFAPSEPAASPTSLCQPGPAISSIPHLQPPKLACTATAPRPPSAAQLHALGATGPLPPRLHFSSLKSPLKPSLVFNGIKAINDGVKLPGHPSSALPRPPIKGEHPHRVSLHLSPLLFPSLHA
jgi:hypothetical protein